MRRNGHPRQLADTLDLLPVTAVKHGLDPHPGDENAIVELAPNENARIAICRGVQPARINSYLSYSACPHVPSACTDLERGAFFAAPLRAFARLRSCTLPTAAFSGGCWRATSQKSSAPPG